MLFKQAIDQALQSLDAQLCMKLSLKPGRPLSEIETTLKKCLLMSPPQFIAYPVPENAQIDLPSNLTRFPIPEGGSQNFSERGSTESKGDREEKRELEVQSPKSIQAKSTDKALPRLEPDTLAKRKQLSEQSTRTLSTTTLAQKTSPTSSMTEAEQIQNSEQEQNTVNVSSTVLTSSIAMMHDPLLKFNLGWYQFLEQPSEIFKQTMSDNLRIRTETCPLDILGHNKLLILFRFRRVLARRSEQAWVLLKERETLIAQGKPYSETFIDANLADELLKDIQEAQSLLTAARGLSQTSLTTNFVHTAMAGGAEELLDTLEYLIKNYLEFCQKVDAKTGRKSSERYAFQDVLPGTITQVNDSAIEAQLEMSQYILANIHADAQSAAHSKRVQGTIWSLPTWVGSFVPSLSQQKIQQVIDFFVALNQGLRTLSSQDRKPVAPSARYDHSPEVDALVLNSVDTFGLASRELTPALSMHAQRLTTTYQDLHKNVLNHSSDMVRSAHRSTCSLAAGK